MKMLRIVTVPTLVCALLVVSDRRAEAISPLPDTASSCTTSNGGSGCFKITNNHATGQFAISGVATGTASAVVGTSTQGPAFKGTTSGAFMIAIQGVSTGSNGIAVRGETTGTGSTAKGGSFWAPNGYGVSGGSTTSVAVYGESISGTGVKGISQSAIGITGLSQKSTGNGDPATTVAVGVEGISDATSSVGIAVRGRLSHATDSSCAAVYGDAGLAGSSGSGVVGVSTNGWGVKGQATSNGSGVAGIASAGIGVYAETSSASQPAVYAQTPTTSGLAFYGAGGIHLDGDTAEKLNGGMWTGTSDRRVKKDVNDFHRGISELMRVRPIRFKYNGLGGTDDNGKEYVGVIAQELEQIVPGMIHSRKGKLHKGDADDTDIKVVDPSDFTYMLINAVKQQQRTIEKQQQAIDQQGARLTELERRSPPVAASVFPGGLGAWAALALLPIGLLIGRKRR